MHRTARLLLSLASALTLLGIIASMSWAKPFEPDDPNFEPDVSAQTPYAGQWSLVNQAPASIRYPAHTSPSGHETKAVEIYNTGLDHQVWPAWRKGWTGGGVTIGLVGDGVSLEHPDLDVRGGMSTGLDDTGTVPGTDGGPADDNSVTATMAAGLAAAVGGNAIGMAGHAPKAQISSMNVTYADQGRVSPAPPCAFYWKAGLDWTDHTEPQFLPQANHIVETTRMQIKCDVAPATAFEYTPESRNTYAAVSRMGKNGLLLARGAGDGRKTRRQDANIYVENNHPSAIVASSTGSAGEFALGSCFGSSVFCTALSLSADLGRAGAEPYANGLGVPATDLAGAAGLNFEQDGQTLMPDVADTDYTAQFGTAAASAASLAGVLALAKQANPAMTPRMAKHLLARTCMVVDQDDQSEASAWSAGGKTYGGWQTNGAGLKFNPNYGFGLVDAWSLVQATIDAAYVSAESIWSTGVLEVNKADGEIPPGDPSGKSRTISVTVPQRLKQHLEAVEVFVEMTGTDRGRWQIVLTKGDVSSRLWTPSGDYPASDQEYGDLNPSGGLSRLLLTHAFWGESPDGEYTLSVSNPRGAGQARWLSWGLVLHMGELVNESSQMVVAENVTAMGLCLDHSSTRMQVEEYVTLSLAGDGYLKEGVLYLDGILDKATTLQAPALDPGLTEVVDYVSFDRGAKVQVTNGNLNKGLQGAVSLPGGTDNRGGVFYNSIVSGGGGGCSLGMAGPWWGPLLILAALGATALRRRGDGPGK